MEVQAETIRQYVVENFLFGNDEEFDDEISFIDEGIIDSTGILELVSFLEQTYSITIDDQELIPENLDSIKNIQGFLKNKIGTE